MSQPNSQTGKNHLALPSNNHHLNPDQLASLEMSQLLSNPLVPSPQLSLDILAALNPQLSNQLSQLAPFMAPFVSNQLFSQLGPQVNPSGPQQQLPLSWLQLAPPPPPPPTSADTIPKRHSPRSNRDKKLKSSMNINNQKQLDISPTKSREIREFASATCLKAQEHFNLSFAYADDLAVALNLCCCAATRLSSVIDDPPVDWDIDTLHKIRLTRKRYAERWRELYRMFILKKNSAQPPSPVPDEAGKKSKVQLNQYIQVSTDVVHKKTPRKPLTKPLKSILKKPAKKYVENGLETRSSLSVSSLSLSSCSLESLSKSQSSIPLSFPPLCKETGTQTSPITSKQSCNNNNNLPPISSLIAPQKHYILPTDDGTPIRRISTAPDDPQSTNYFKSLQVSIQAYSTPSDNGSTTKPLGTVNKENRPPSNSNSTLPTLRTHTQPPPAKSPYKPHAKAQFQEPLSTKNLPMKRSTCFTPPPPRRFSPEEHSRLNTGSQEWTRLCTEV